MNQTLSKPDRIAISPSADRRVFITDLELMAVLGIHAHEKIQAQRIVVNIQLLVHDAGQDHNDELANVVCYEQVVENVKQIVAGGHVHLVETLAESIAARCLEDARVHTARVRIEKPDAISIAASVGIEIERTKRPVR